MLTTGSVRTDAGIGAEGHLDAGFQRFPEVVALQLAKFGVMLQEVRRCGSVLAACLDTFFVVNIHVEVSAALDGQGDAFVVDHLGMLDGGGAGQNGVLNPLRGVSVYCHSQAKVTGFVNRSIEFFGRKFQRTGIASVRQHCASGEDFDHVNPVVGQLTNPLPNFPWTVGLSVVQIPRELNIGCLSCHGAGTASNRDVGAGDVHAGARDVATSNGIAQGHVVEGAVSANVSHRGESGLKHLSRVGHRLQNDLGSSFAQHVEGFATDLTVGNVGVAIDQTGQHRHRGEINDLRPGGYGQAFSDFGDPMIANEDDLIG